MILIPKLLIHQLELLAVLLGARNLNFVEKSLLLKIKEMIFWTDSKFVLHWLQSKKMLSTFTQRRVDEIRSSSNIDFRYMATHDNTGDILSRGIGAMKLHECKLWWSRPNWLSQDKNNWPIRNVYEVSKEALADFSKNKRTKKYFRNFFWSRGRSYENLTLKWGRRIQQLQQTCSEQSKISF